MASYDVVVKLVDQTKSSMRNIESGLKNIESQAARANKSLGSVGSALAAIVTGATAGKILETAKNFGDLEARIRATSGSATNTAAVMTYLTDTANRLGISVQDAGKAFSILRANGIDASYKSLETWTKLAVTSGRTTEDIADAVANAYQGSFGKISKATEDLIQVENKYGSFIVKFRGVVVDTVGSSAQAVDAIRKFTEQNAAFADAFDAKSKGTSAALNRLSNALTGNVGFAQLDKSVGGLLDKFTQFLSGTNGVGRAVDYLSKAINFLGDNFETILTVVQIVGSFFLVGAIFKGLTIIGGLAITLGNSIRSLGYFFLDFKSNVGKAIAYVVTAWKSWYTQITGASQPIVNVFDAIARAVGVSFGTIVKTIGSLLTSFAAPFTAVIAYVSGLFDPLLDKLGSVYDGIKKFFGLGKTASDVTVGTPTGAGYRSGPGMAAQAAKPGDGVNIATGLSAAVAGTSNPGVPGNTFLQDIIGNLSKAKSEIAPLQNALKKALATGDLSLASKLFEELSSRTEQFGKVTRKNSELIERDFVLALDKATEELRQRGEELANAVLMEKKFANELKANAQALTEQGMKLADASYMSEKFKQELQANAQALTEQSMKLADASYMTEKFKQELQASQQSLTEQGMKLADATYMSEKFKQEVLGSSQALAEAALKLKDAYYQNAIFENSLIATRQGVEQQTITLGKLSQAYADGTVSLQEYSNALGQVDAALLTSTQVLDQALGAAQREAGINRTRATALEELNAKFRSGAVDAKAYRIAASGLGGDTDAIDRTVNVYGTARDQIIEDNEFIKKSIGSAAKTFSDEFTGAIMKGQFSFSSFKNFLTNILNDIAQRIIKRQFADPIADYMTQMASQVFGKGGVIPTQAGEGAVSASDSMTTIFTGLAGKTKEIFSNMSSGISTIFDGMGSGLMDSMSGIFDWIMNGIGSIGSSLGGMGSSISGLFSGGGGGDLLGSVAGFFSGFFADGGTLGAGQYGIAGEAGPEMITGPATITPMTQDAQEPLIVNFNLNALDTQSGTEFLIKNKAVISKVIEDAYNRRGKRGPITA